MESIYIVLVFVAVLGGWMGFNYIRLRRAATLLENEDFAAKISTSQLIDLREPSEYRKKAYHGCS